MVPADVPPSMRTPRPLVFILVVLVALPAASAASGTLVAQSMWGTKAQIDIEKLWWVERPVWLERVAGRGIRIGVVDTGIDATHPDLEDVVVGFRDFTGDRRGVFREEPYDDHGHGTHVAGIIAGRGHLQWNPLHYYWLSGMRGVAPEAELLVAKAINHRGFGTDQTVADSIVWAMDPNGDGDLSDGCNIINLSIGIERPSETGDRPAFLVGSETKRAIQLALAQGVAVVVSSGNEASVVVAEPGDIYGVISVGAIDRDDNVPAFSNSGQYLDLVAPGVIVSSYPVALDTFDFAQDGYVGMAGTSMAAPVVTAVIALMMEADPALAAKSTTKNQNGKLEFIQKTLADTADPLGAVHMERAGAGSVNAYAAVKAVDVGDASIDWAFLLMATGGAGMLWVLFVMLPKAIGRRRQRMPDDNEEPSQG